MGILNPTEWEDGTMDIYIERFWWLKDTYQNTNMSALVVDEDEDLSIIDLGKCCNPPIRSKYIDLSKCQKGDYQLFCKHLLQFQYDGLLIDNIDKIPNDEDREDWESFVRFALKREDEYPLPPSGDCIYFSKMHIAARCKEYPEYLKGKSLLCIIIGCNNRYHSDEDSI